MKRIIFLITGFMLISEAGQSNPLPMITVTEYSVDPPWIEITTDFIIQGDTFWTSAGPVIITDLDPDQGWIAVLDSSNTTGFMLDPQSDFIHFSYFDEVNVDYGNYGGICLPPLPGESVIGGYHYFYPGNAEVVYNFSTEPEPGNWSEFGVNGCWGETDLVINEINLHCTWEPNSGFIELYNKGTDTVSTDNRTLIANARLELPGGLQIPPGGFLVIDETDFPDGFNPDFLSDNLYYTNGSAAFDQVGWSSDHGENVSFMRYPDGDVDPNNWDDFRGYNDESSYTFEDGFPSRGAPNRHESPGFVVIGTRAVGEESFVDLYWTNPIWDEMYNSSIAIRSDDHFPETIDDGDIAYQGNEQHVIDYGLAPEHWYYYTVFARNDGGEYSIPTDESRASVYLGSGVGVDEAEIPHRISYFRAYPNPFNAATTIEYGLTESSYFTLSVYNLLGQKIVTFFEGSMDAGEHSFLWNASAFPTGVYFARLEATDQSETVKMVLLR